MASIEPIIPGIYARSSSLVQTTRDHDRDRVDDEELTEAQTRDLENLLGVQLRAGFSLLSPGLLTWQDHFRPFHAIVEGLETDTLTRFLDTNTFYRRPDIADAPSLDEDGLARFAEEAFPPIGSPAGLYTIPSPTAWVTAARNEDGEYPDPALAETIATEIYPDILELLTDRAQALALADPWLATHPDPDELAGSLDPVVEAAGELETILQLPFQDAQAALDAGLAEPVDTIVIDLHRTDRDVLDAIPQGTRPGLGLVDARSSLVEREDLLLLSLERAVQATSADTLYVAPNGSLQHVPETIARRKLRTLGRAAHAANAKLGGDSL